MSNIQLFRVSSGKASELKGYASDLEKPLQTLIENNLDALFGIRFLASEYSTGKTHAGRIDSLGLDENDCPVIPEYKRSTGENVINQGLFYLDWLMDHQAEFKLLVMERLGQGAAGNIDWSAPRLVCVAADFTNYDGHAVQQINRNIELVRYRRFGEELLLLELVNASSSSPARPPARATTPRKSASKPADAPASPSAATAAPTGIPRKGTDRTYAEWLPLLSTDMKDLLTSLEDYIGSLGDDVQRNELKLYVAFKRLKNFGTIVPQAAKLLLYLRLNPDRLPAMPPNARDARKFGHWGTGDLELSIANMVELDAAKALILAAYEGRG
jgi:predicted transport protein